MTWLGLALLAVAVVTDLRRREIPDWIPVALLLCALLAEATGLEPVGWVARLLGLGLAFGIGALLFALGAWGGGDAKLLAGLGALLGWREFLELGVWIALVGGVLALVAALREQREIAYAPAFAVGMLVFLVARCGGLHVLP